MSRPKRWIQHLQWLAEAAIVMPMLCLGGIFPEMLLPPIASCMGTLIYFLFAADRCWCLLNLRIAFGDQLDDRQLQRLARAAFAHQVLLYCETIRLTRRWINQRLIIEGLEHVPAILAAKHGVIAVTGHLGNFEFIPPALSQIGLSNLVVSRPLDNPYFRWVQEGCRRRYGTRFTGKDTPGVRKAMRFLQQGGGVIIAIDLNTIRHPVFVNLFGFPAATPRGAAEMALRSGSEVILITAHRRADGRFGVKLQPPFHLIRTGDEQADIASNMQQFTTALEKELLRWPEQYYWQHPRFRLRPDGSTWTSQTSWASVQDPLQAKQRIGQ